MEIRWEVLKSMLDNFQQLRDRTEEYLSSKRPSLDINCPDHTSSKVKKSMRKAVREYRKEHLRK
jgi:hypothetical protein